jgi:hypothetical protein
MYSPPKAKPLQETESDQKDRGKHPDRRVARQTSNYDAPNAHDQQGKGEDRLSSDPVAVVPEHHAAKWTR